MVYPPLKFLESQKEVLVETPETPLDLPLVILLLTYDLSPQFSSQIKKHLRLGTNHHLDEKHIQYTIHLGHMCRVGVITLKM